uniref:Reverse transcriptase Ty1/copia-type domain-containing protein n=1 Tax=Chromera velia CCMP2878 TaxID=1169474 RepID=A0A0G4HVX6_9ALVE|eukprot:Cvel_8916.t1-p1 / transcript=Cvel_8916.t1 / gene=Cvel_8916 / organism=Chromera_velia_CCMP2878 / gene_product=hypothetical protein / transcript_product=hypothetical protein / location=Cvel_scaffold502:12247-14193(-) / protein_length=223 / sequence_SO=supercontig / SO=protein_coding / is_pseudo=false
MALHTNELGTSPYYEKNDSKYEERECACATATCSRGSTRGAAASGSSSTRRASARTHTTTESASSAEGCCGDPIISRPATRGEIESGRFEKSRLDDSEFCGLLDNGVFGERVMRQEVVAVTNMGEYAGVKKKPGGEEKEKDRIVIKGGADPWVYDTYAGVLAQQSLLTCLSYIITIGKVIYSVDVVKAFQQIEDRHKHSLGVLGVQIPTGLPELPVENPFPEK